MDAKMVDRYSLKACLVLFNFVGFVTKCMLHHIEALDDVVKLLVTHLDSCLHYFHGLRAQCIEGAALLWVAVACLVT